MRPQNESTALAPAGDLHRAADASGRRWCSKRIVALRNKWDWPTHIVGTWSWPSSPRFGVWVRAPSPVRLRMRRNRQRWLDPSARRGGTKDALAYRSAYFPQMLADAPPLESLAGAFARPPTALRKGRLDDGQTGHKRDTDPNHEDDTRRGSDRRERALGRQKKRPPECYPKSFARLSTVCDGAR